MAQNCPGWKGCPVAMDHDTWHGVSVLCQVWFYELPSLSLLLQNGDGRGFLNSLLSGLIFYKGIWEVCNIRLFCLSRKDTEDTKFLFLSVSASLREIVFKLQGIQNPGSFQSVTASEADSLRVSVFPSFTSCMVFSMRGSAAFRRCLTESSIAASSSVISDEASIHSPIMKLTDNVWNTPSQCFWSHHRSNGDISVEQGFL